MVGILLAILMLGLVIIVHELGHFLVAKLFGVYVQRFSVGFGPVLLAKRIGETEYALSAIPLGGYVAMAQQMSTAEDLPSERYFDNQSALKRLVIMLAGPMSNLFLAIILFLTVFLRDGVWLPSNITGGVTEGSPAARAGLRPGDVIKTISCNNENGEGTLRLVIENSDKPLEDLLSVIRNPDCQSVSVLVQREGELAPLTISIVPEQVVGKNEFGEEIRYRAIGFQPRPVQTTGLVVSAKETFNKTKTGLGLMYTGINKLFRGDVPRDSVAGPVGIVSASGEAYNNQGLSGLMWIAAIISLNLMVLNLLPIPALDGGQMAVILVEVVIGRKLSTRIHIFIQMVGFVLMIALAVWATSNDLGRLFGK